MKSQTENLEHASVRQYCKSVRVPVVGANFVTLAEQAVKENHSHIRYLEALLAMECEERDRHAISNRIRDAQLPRLWRISTSRRRRRSRRRRSANWPKAATSREANRWC